MILANQGRRASLRSALAPGYHIARLRRWALPIPDAKSGLTLKISNKKNPCVLLPQIHRSQQSQRSSRQI